MTEPGYAQLYLSAAKLRGLAYLVECQGEPMSMPERMEEVHWGIALVLEDLAKEIREVAENLENPEVTAEATDASAS